MSPTQQTPTEAPAREPRADSSRLEALIQMALARMDALEAEQPDQLFGQFNGIIDAVPSELLDTGMVLEHSFRVHMDGANVVVAAGDCYWWAAGTPAEEKTSLSEDGTSTWARPGAGTATVYVKLTISGATATFTLHYSEVDAVPTVTDTVRVRRLALVPASGRIRQTWSSDIVYELGS